jgi:mRNA interferase MazF
MDYNNYSRWDVLITPFPFVDSAQSKPRPVVVLSSKEFNDSNGHIICAMITTSKKIAWKDDYIILNLTTPNLPKPSIIRWKIFTLPVEIIKRKIGEIGIEDKANLTSHIAKILIA